MAKLSSIGSNIFISEHDLYDICILANDVLTTDIHDAVSSGYLNEVKSQVERGEKITDFLFDIAVVGEQIEIMKYFVSLNIFTLQSKIEIAISHKKLNSLKYLVSLGCDPLIFTDILFERLVYDKDYNVIKYLLSVGYEKNTEKLFDCNFEILYYAYKLGHNFILTNDTINYLITRTFHSDNLDALCFLFSYCNPGNNTITNFLYSADWKRINRRKRMNIALKNL